MLGDRMLLTLESRGKWLYDQYLKKYHKYLYSKHWDEDELEELDYTLRSYIESSRDVQVWVERRLAFMEDVLDIAG